jgi:hypothetical protein
MLLAAFLFGFMQYVPLLAYTTTWARALTTFHTLITLPMDIFGRNRK